MSLDMARCALGLLNQGDRPLHPAGDIPGGGKYMRKWVKEGMWDDSVRERKSFGSGEPGF